MEARGHFTDLQQYLTSQPEYTPASFDIILQGDDQTPNYRVLHSSGHSNTQDTLAVYQYVDPATLRPSVQALFRDARTTLPDKLSAWLYPCGNDPRAVFYECMYVPTIQTRFRQSNGLRIGSVTVHSPLNRISSVFNANQVPGLSSLIPLVIDGRATVTNIIDASNDTDTGAFRLHRGLFVPLY